MESSHKEVLTTEPLSIFREMKTALEHREARAAQPDDVITVAQVTPQDVEYQHLLNAGVTEDEMRSKGIARQRLQDAGFAFVNRMYLPNKMETMEKPLINTSVNGYDFGSRILLRQEELDLIATEQSKSLQGIDINAMREDMLLLMMSAHYDRPRNFRQRNNAFMLARHQLQDQAQFDNYFQQWADANNLSELHPVQQRIQFMKEYLLNEFPWTEDISSFPVVRGVSAMKAPTRVRNLQGLPSPVLSSGFTFPEFSLDVHLGTPERSQGRRLNMMVWHLAGFGLSEEGASTGKATDQQYMTIADHHSLFFAGKTEQEVKARRDLEMSQIEKTLSTDEDEILEQMAVKMTQLMKSDTFN